MSLTLAPALANRLAYTASLKTAMTGASDCRIDIRSGSKLRQGRFFAELERP